ncbi:uncharacterized protein CCR75_003383 [Bremia lactucae]|uniref:Bromo domain-containing protein n=1 Tax=Bremia lactucae TaxID=4779 RepID=A0A976FI81_BRELC|nr:hypothetical protein CCR75_003383 [Bremia lactucae]
MISEAAHSECVRLLDLLTNSRVQESWSWVFMMPVNIPGYDKVIKKPMDLGTIKKNLGIKPSRCRFKSHEKFARDVRLVFQNALLYNKDDQDVKGSVYAAAQHLRRVFETAYAKAIENVFRADDAAKAAHREAKEEKRKAECGDATRVDGEGAVISNLSPSHNHQSSSSSHHSSHRHRSRSDGEDGRKQKHKHSKKEKKSKKSKQKSRDRDREHRHGSSSTGERKKKYHQSELDRSIASSLNDKAMSVSILKAPVPPPSLPSSSALMLQQEVSLARMTDGKVTACLSVLMKLIKYKEGNISPAAPFLQPVDLSHFPDYRVKVPNRMHLYGVQKKLHRGSYATMDAFAYDMRLIFSNCFVYNSDVILSKIMRNHAVTLLKLFESQFMKIGGSWPGVPDRWKCHQIIHEILAHRTAGQETAQWFKYPIESYYDSPDQIPYNYYEVVKAPMDIGTVSSKLHLGVYKNMSEFIAGMKLVFDNCISYWQSDPQGQTYCESAETLLRLLRSQSTIFINLSGSNAASKDKQRPHVPALFKAKSASDTSSSLSSSVSTAEIEHEISKKQPSSKPYPSMSSKLSKSSKYLKSSKSSKSSKLSRSRDTGTGLPEKDLCLGIMKQLRAHKMEGFGGVSVKTAGPFLTAVDTTKYSDYLSIVSEPMDFAKIERKLKSDRYGSVDEFSADVHLIFSNCHKYNSDPVEGADIRAMATILRNYFVELYNEKLGPLDGMANILIQSSTNATQAAVVPTSLNSLQLKLPEEPSRSLVAKAHTKVGVLHKPVEKLPAPSPSKKQLSIPAAANASSTIAREFLRAPEILKQVNTVAPAAIISTKPLDMVRTLITETSSSVASKELPSDSRDLSNLTPEMSKRLRKELKEKRRKEKKIKKEKKKKDKEKKRDKKEKKERSKLTAPQELGLPTEKNSTALALPPAIATVANPSAALAALPPTVHALGSAAVASKRGMVEPHVTTSSVSSKKSKKHKKSNLKSWETACDRVLNRLGKIEQVAKLHFNHPLLEIFPHLATEYKTLVSNPMDLRTLRELLHAHALTQADFLCKGRLIFQNAITFNCADDQASIQVRKMSAHLLWYFDSLCAELQIVSSLEAFGEQSLAKRNQLRSERAEFVSTVSVEFKAKECQKLLRALNSQKFDKNCWPFRKPVRVLFPALSPDYFEVVKTPMDLSTIAEKLAAFEYKMHGDFIRDVRLTFENAISYNRADKERAEWSVYSAAAHMLSVVDDLWGDVTLEVTEKTRRRNLLRKERLNDPKRKRSDDLESKMQKSHQPTSEAESHHQSDQKSRAEESVGSSTFVKTLDKCASLTRNNATSTSVVGTIVVGGARGSSEDATSSEATRVKLQLMPSRPNMERMNKQERKAEEKRRKRARRDEEMARTEKRRRTAVAATDDALREAEIRSRRKLQKLEMAESVLLREERERRMAEEKAERARRSQMKLNAAAWTGVLLPKRVLSKQTAFWARKRPKLQVPVAFLPAVINA